MHAVMGIIYGGALAHLVPEIWRWAHDPTGFSRWDAPPSLRVILPLGRRRAALGAARPRRRLRALAALRSPGRA